jgi:hypothetical protein
MITRTKKIAGGFLVTMTIGALIVGQKQANEYSKFLNRVDAPVVKNEIAIKTYKSTNIKKASSLKSNLKSNFQDSLAMRESSLRFDIKGGANNHYLGKYQLGRDAFRDIFKVTYYKDENGKYVPDFSEGDAQYNWARENVELGLWSQEAQDRCFEKWVEVLKVQLSNEIKTIDKIGTIKGIKITESGLIAAAHLCGHGAVKDFINSEGRNIAADGNSVKLTEYLKEFAGYEC